MGKMYNENLSRIVAPVSAVNKFLHNFRGTLIEKLMIKGEGYAIEYHMTLKANKYGDHCNANQKRYGLDGFVDLVSKRLCTDDFCDSFEIEKNNAKPFRIILSGFGGREGETTNYPTIALGEGNSTKEAYDDLLAELKTINCRYY